MFISHYNVLKSDDSDGISDNDLNEKYTLLQNNHRRLLGVTTALTEALESTVRGDQLNLEDTLNQCMKIYPELFTFQHKKPQSKYFSKQKIYNTSVSEDHSDIPMVEKLSNATNAYKIQQAENKNQIHNEERINTATENTFNQKQTNDGGKSAVFIAMEQDVSEKNTIQPIRLSGIPAPKNKRKFNGEKLSINTHEDFLNINQIGDSSPYLMLTPEIKRNSFSSIPEKENIQLIPSPYGSITTNQEMFDENCYIVNHPESDNDHLHTKYMHFYEKQDLPNTDFLHRVDGKHKRKTNMSVYNTETEPTKHKSSQVLKANTYWPYEIIVQQSIPPKTERAQDTNGNVWIKIKPEHTENDSDALNASYTSRINVNPNAQTQTIIAKPLETCIIITKRIDSSPHIPQDLNESTNKTNDAEKKEQNDHRGDSKNVDQFVEEKSVEVISKNVTMDKLQKLSTGLKLKTNEMETKAIRSVEEPCESKNQTEINSVDPRYFMNGYELCENSKLNNSSTNEAKKIYYKKIKKDLLKGSPKDTATILQSLRLTLIHSLAKERADLITSYVDYDILNINHSKTLLENILPNEIVNGWDLILQQMILKFLNTICSIWKGRDYLSSNTRTISCLQNYFFEKNTTKTSPDTISKDMLIAVLHKLCTRENQHGILVNSGVVEKIFYNIWESHESMTLYRLRHSLGLLINLCVYNSGRSLLEPMSSEMLSLLTVLLKKNDKKIIPYVARLIYVLMASEKFHKQAKDIDLLSTLEKSINITNKRLKLQLDVLKSVINQSSPHEYLIGSEESFLLNIEAEMDELEEEVEMGEPCLTTTKSDDSAAIKGTSSINKKSDKLNSVKKSYTELNDDISSETSKKNIRQSAEIKSFKKNPMTKQVVPKRIKQRNIKTSETGEPSQIKYKSFMHIPNKKENAKPNKALNKPLLSNESLKQKYNAKLINKHEIDEDRDESNINYVDLREITASSHSSMSRKNSSDKLCNNLSSCVEKNTTCDELDEISDKEKHTSFVVLSENDSNKTMSLDLNLSSTSDSINSLEQIQLPEDIKKAEELSTKLTSAKEKNSRLTTTNVLTINPDKSHNVSLFIQQGNISEIDYDYCEDTKEIQSPINCDNIFKDNRQSPYKGLFMEGQKHMTTSNKSSKQNDDNSNEASGNATATALPSDNKM